MPVLSRMRALMLRPFVRSTLAGGTSSFDMRQVLDGGVLIARLPKGELGEDGARLLGSLLLASVWQSALSRSNIPEARRRDATCYVDEAHGVLNLSGNVGDILAEARGYHLSFVLAHQHLDQMPPELRRGLSANTRNKAFFTMSPEDARELSRHTEPELEAEDLSRLEKYTAAVRLMVDGGETPAFTIRTRPPVAAGSGGIDLRALRAALVAKAPPRPAEPVYGNGSEDPALSAYYRDVEQVQAEYGVPSETWAGPSSGGGRAESGLIPGFPDWSGDDPEDENPQVRGRR